MMPPAATGSGESVFVIVTSGWSLGSGVAVGVLVGVGVIVGVDVLVGVDVIVGVFVFVAVGVGVRVAVGGVPQVITSVSDVPFPSECFTLASSVSSVLPGP